jgi:hypothetical protein
MIRAGQITREEAYTRCRSDSRPRVHSLEEAWRELGVTEEQVNKALNKLREKMIRQYLKGTSFETCVSSYSPSTSPQTLEAPRQEPTTLPGG